MKLVIPRMGTMQQAGAAPAPSYLLIKNDPDNVSSPDVWFNFATPLSDVYFEYTASFHNLNLLPTVNAAPGTMIATPDDYVGGSAGPSTGYLSVNYESDRGVDTDWIFGLAGQGGAGFNVGGNVVEAQEHLVQAHMVGTGIIPSGPGVGQQGWNLEVRIDGGSIGVASGWATAGVDRSVLNGFALTANGGGGATEWRVASARAGTTGWGSNNLFEANYASGATTTVPGPWTGATVGAGVLTIVNP